MTDALLARHSPADRVAFGGSGERTAADLLRDAAAVADALPERVVERPLALMGVRRDVYACIAALLGAWARGYEVLIPPADVTREGFLRMAQRADVGAVLHDTASSAALPIAQILENAAPERRLSDATCAQQGVLHFAALEESEDAPALRVTGTQLLREAALIGLSLALPERAAYACSLMPSTRYAWAAGVFWPLLCGGSVLRDDPRSSAWVEQAARGAHTGSARRAAVAGSRREPAPSRTAASAPSRTAASAPSRTAASAPSRTAPETDWLELDATHDHDASASLREASSPSADAAVEVGVSGRAAAREGDVSTRDAMLSAGEAGASGRAAALEVGVSGRAAAREGDVSTRDAMLSAREAGASGPAAAGEVGVSGRAAAGEVGVSGRDAALERGVSMRAAGVSQRAAAPRMGWMERDDARVVGGSVHDGVRAAGWVERGAGEVLAAAPAEAVALSRVVVIGAPAQLRLLLRGSPQVFAEGQWVVALGAPLVAAGFQQLRAAGLVVSDVFATRQLGCLGVRDAEDEAFRPLPEVSLRTRTIADGVQLTGPHFQAASMHATVNAEGGFLAGGVGVRRAEWEERIAWMDGVQDAALLAASTERAFRLAVSLAGSAREERALKARVMSELPELELREWRSLRRRDGVPLPTASFAAGRCELSRNGAGRHDRASLLRLFGRAPDGAPLSWELRVERERVEAGRAVRYVQVPERYGYFTGHFPGYPLLPGAAQLSELVIPFVRAVRPELGRLIRMARLKFQERIVPNDLIEVSISFGSVSAQEHSVEFALKRGDSVCANGRLWFAAADGGESRPS